MRKLRLVLILGSLFVGVLAGAASAQAQQAQLDRSFGQNGVVAVQPTIPPPWREAYVRKMAAGPGGDSFVLFERAYCGGQAGCFSGNALFHYLADGSLDPSFGGPGGAYELPPEGEGLATIAVDSRGRPLLARASRTRVVVHRLAASGLPDPSFGEEGAVALACQCEYNETQLIPGPAGTLTVALPRRQTGSGLGASSAMSGTTMTLIRLKANGSKDRSFGNSGTAGFGLRGAEAPVASATSASGALYLAGAGCCASRVSSYVVRVSAKGRLDGRFTKQSQRSLRSIESLNTLEQSINAVIVRPGGKIDLLGAASYETGFELRLNPNGRPHRNFASSGIRVLPLPVASAALGNGGATLAVSDENLSGAGVLMRIFGGGRLDPTFGPKGTPVPGKGAGLTVVPQNGGKVLVLDLGVQECRGDCAVEPRLVRYLEGSAPKRG